jgi:DNA end-binding protein Ku
MPPNRATFSNYQPQPAVEGNTARGSERAAGQKEMLMPIEGKKPKEAAGKKPAARPQRKSA